MIEYQLWSPKGDIDLDRVLTGFLLDVKAKRPDLVLGKDVGAGINMPLFDEYSDWRTAVDPGDATETYSSWSAIEGLRSSRTRHSALWVGISHPGDLAFEALRADPEMPMIHCHETVIRGMRGGLSDDFVSYLVRHDLVATGVRLDEHVTVFIDGEWRDASPPETLPDAR